VPSARSGITSLKASLKAVALVIIVFSAISYLISLALGPVLFYSTSDGMAASAQRIHGLYIELFMVIPVPVPIATSMGALFAVILAFFIVCMILAWWDRDGFLNSVRGGLSKSISLAKSNFLFIMPLVASALVAATVIISSFQESQGVQTGSINFPTTNPYVILTELSFAPLDEEFAFRITSIGLIVGLVLLVLYRQDPRIKGLKNKGKLVLLAMFSPELAKAKLGYRNIRANGFPRGISPVEWILIILTSLGFGLAHYLSGSGWDVGKVSTAFLAGLVFAIMYVSYGAYADILLHWYFNYYFDVLSYAGAAYGGVFNVLNDLANYVAILGGGIILVVFLVYSAYRIGNYLAAITSGNPATPISIA
jgi:hypothetical protein